MDRHMIDGGSVFIISYFEPVQSLSCLNQGLENIHFSYTDFPVATPSCKGVWEADKL